MTGGEDGGGADLSELHALLDRAAQSMVPPDLKEKGWVYRDLPRCSAEYWTKLLEILGEGNYQLLTYAEYADGDRRGQMFVGPVGLKNAAAYAAERVRP